MSDDLLSAWTNRSVLVTGATGTVGVPVVCSFKAAGAHVTGVARRIRPGSTAVLWDLGHEPIPEALERPWDLVVHTAASTRWTMTLEEATSANVDSTRAAADLGRLAERFVHVSTAFVRGPDGCAAPEDPEAFRNTYEWSKAKSEQIVRAAIAPERLAIVRPPLIIGDRHTGEIARFSGTYSILHSLTSGILAAVVGDDQTRIELVPVSDVVEAIVEAAGAPGQESAPSEEIILGAGTDAVKMGELVSIGCSQINRFRATNGIAAIEAPPFIPTESWHRFFLPFGREHFSRRQLQAIDLLSEFQAYTTTTAPIAPNRRVANPAAALTASVRWWCQTHPRVALREPRQWQSRQLSDTAMSAAEDPA